MTSLFIHLIKLVQTDDCKKKIKCVDSSIPEKLVSTPTLQMNLLLFFAIHGMSYQSAVDLILVILISTQPSRNPPSGSFVGIILSDTDLWNNIHDAGVRNLY